MKKGMIGILSALAGGIVGAFGVGKSMNNALQNKKKLSDKHFELFLMMNQWVRIKQEEKSLVEYFERNNFNSIAIYGMSYVGETLAEELEGSSIRIQYAIDQKADNIFADFDVVTIDDELENVDAIVVTAITCFEEIEKNLQDKITCPVLSLKDILLYEI